MTQSFIVVATQLRASPSLIGLLLALERGGTRARDGQRKRNRIIFVLIDEFLNLLFWPAKEEFNRLGQAATIMSAERYPARTHIALLDMPAVL